MEKKNDVRIEKAEKEDLSDILELQYTAYQSEAELFGGKKIPPLTQTLEEVIEEYNDGVILKMLNEEDKIIGSVRAKEDAGTVYVGKLMVYPEYQKRGYGTRLLLEIEKYFDADRFELFTSTRSESNIRMYQKMGYYIFDTKKVDNELEFVYLEKRK
ncbi:MAG: GNAT family N-acetyltransferase [Eubacterium sp.]|nr:GNAT family N-acetyltransferase [Eubacterium sp.]